MFNSISGFAGTIPSDNISLFKNLFPDANIEIDEIIETQMNYASFQTGAKNSTWYSDGYTGNTNSSIAILDSGINLNQAFLRNKISGLENFIEDSSIYDDFGHGTLISSIVAGTGTDLYNSDMPSIVNLYGNYSHLDIFGLDPSPKNFTKKIFSFNISKINSEIYLNSSWNLISSGIDGFWFELYCDNSLVNSSLNLAPNQRNVIVHQVSESGLGVYDFYIKYHRQTNKYPIFSSNSSISIFPEFYVKNNNHFTGIANSSKLLAYKVINKTGKGYVSDLISALGSIIQNRTKYHIVSACLSIGTFGDNFTAINKVIDSVIDEGIIVIVAAGNSGPASTEFALNKLAIDNDAIVVGATNDKDQITSYSGIGEQIDIVAPGGSNLANHRMVISADARSNSTTTGIGTSISTAIVSAVTNILIEVIWGNWNQWESQDVEERINIIKTILLMTATETGLEREDDPDTNIDEGLYSPTSFSGLLSSIKDEHEGYGRINIQVAIDALTKYLEENTSINEYLYSSEENPLGKHAFARRVILEPNIQYIFNITNMDNTANFDLFLFSNESKQNGEPILLQTSRKWYRNSNFLYFIPKNNQTECIIIVKAANGYGNFTIKVSTVDNLFIPQLTVPEITYYGGSKNTTVMGYQEYIGSYPPTNYSIDRYRFYINYLDNDSHNVPPQEVYVSIIEISKNYSMFQFNEIDNNYTNGALFISDYIQLNQPMTYHYYFIASDGTHIARYPEIGELSILIEYPYDSEKFPYKHSFNSGLGNWTFTGTGWGLLNQSNYLDNRSDLFDFSWTSMYFGAYHNYPMNYSYQPKIITDTYPNGTLYSPLFDFNQINENFTIPHMKIGIRTSINSGDLILLQISLNWTNWISLRTFTNEENEWYIEDFNLTEYIGYFIQFRFVSLLDDNFDPVNYKGFILDYFELINHTNFNAPHIYFNLNEDISTLNGSKFEQFSFYCHYFDKDNNYPEFVYIEMEGANYSMINHFGNWNPNSSIIFIKSLLLEDIDNRSFRFHAYDGLYINTTKWFNVNNTIFNFINPEPYQFNVNYSNKLIGYHFSNKSFSDYYVIGTPNPKENTAWFNGDNTWHPITRIGQDYIYGGIGQSYGSANQGYGTNWDAKLITYPLYLRSDHNCYLKFDFEISLQNEFGVSQEDLDRCIVSISIDFGENWITLKEYFYDDEKLSGNESIDISIYGDEVIMVMFTINSNDNVIGLGYGWLLSNIYIGYDKETDFIAPNIHIISPLNQETISSIITIKANLSDNSEVDISRIYIYIDAIIIERQLYSYNRSTGILKYKWDTTYHTDGMHYITITAFDEEGNKKEVTISVIVKNGFFNWRNWGPWIILFISIIVALLILYKLTLKRRRDWIRKKRAEKIRVKEIEKQQKLKSINLSELEEERGRPLTLYCKYCKSWFESNKFDYICPICEHDQIYVAYNCLNCNKWYFKDEPAENFYCKNKTCKDVRLIRRKKEEIKEILENEGIILRKFHRRKNKFSILD